MKLTKFTLFFSLIVCCQSSLFNVPLKILHSRTLKWFKNSQLDRDCAADLTLLMSDAPNLKLWAIKMLDASSKIYPGVLNGNFHSFGDYNECLRIEENIDSRTINGQYCTFRVTIHDKGLSSVLKSSTKSKELDEYLAKPEFREVPHKVKLPVLLVGICLPKSCSVENLEKLVRYPNESLGINVEVSVIKELCLYQGRHLETTKLDHFAFYFFIVIISVVIGSTVYDLYLRLTDRALNVFVVFSAFTNIRRLFSQCPNNHNTLTCLNGIKVISCTWVILGHTVLLHRFISKNVFYIYNEWNHQVWSTFMWSAYYSIETFLAISGFLASYIYLKHSETFSVDLVSFYLIRYIRLTPALLATVLIHTSILKLLANGPYGLYVANYVADNCSTTWWSVFFFFFKIMDFKRCGMHLGYLAVDNQLYLLAPLILFFIKKYPSKAIKGMIFAFILSINYSIVVTVVKKVGFTIFEWTDDFENYVYFSTLYRMPSWLLGMLFGYLFYYRIFKLSKKVNTILWIISLFVMLKLITDQTVFITEEYSLHRSVLWNGLAGPLWSLALCLIIYSCGIGNGGIINDFLSHPLFRILSKLTYSMYLVHFSVLLYYFGNQTATLEFGYFQILSKFIGLFILVVICSVLLYLGFEAPIVSLKDRLETREGEKTMTKNC